ncbi:MAG TPA: hypothetical protein PLG90_09310 [Ignavibacteria bacterium]|nr:hypothetical protein [Ignavibacteria bacterium]
MSKNQKKNIKKPDKIYSPYYDYSLFIIFSIFIILLTSFKITGDDDVFWHLSTGRYILESGTVPSVDVFGFVTSGMEWMPFEWGWDVLTYLIYEAGGYTALSIARTIIFLLIFFLYFLIFKKFKIPNSVTFLMMTLLAFGTIDRLTPRPHIISLLFFVIILYIIIQYKYFDRSNKKILYFLPVIFLFWANMHMGIIAGIFLLGIWVLSEIIIYLKPTSFSSKEIPALSKSELTNLIIIFVICICFMLINPNFFATYIYAYEHTKMKLLETINEWRSPFDSQFGGGFVSNIYKIFLFSGIFILYYSAKKKDLFATLVFIGFAVYSVRAVRFTVDYNIIVSVFISIALGFIITNLKEGKLKNLLTVSPVPKVIISAFLIFCIINLPNNKLYLEHLQYYRISGFGINSEFIPTHLFEFIKQNDIQNIGERPLNHFGTGGFLIWNFPGKKNFIDSRNLNDSIFNEYSNIIGKRPGFEKKLNDYNFDYAIYLAPDLVRAPQEMEQTAISYLSKSPEWSLVFWDDKSFLWLKNEEKFNNIISNYSYKYLTPYNVIYNRAKLDRAILDDKETLLKEIKRKQNEDPNSIILNSFLQNYANKLN